METGQCGHSQKSMAYTHKTELIQGELKLNGTQQHVPEESARKLLLRINLFERKIRKPLEEIYDDPVSATSQYEAKVMPDPSDFKVQDSSIQYSPLMQHINMLAVGKPVVTSVSQSMIQRSCQKKDQTTYVKPLNKTEVGNSSQQMSRSSSVTTTASEPNIKTLLDTFHNFKQSFVHSTKSIQKFPNEYHQVSKGVQFYSNQIEEPKVLTTARPSGSVDSLPTRLTKPFKEDIMTDLYHAMKRSHLMSYYHQTKSDTSISRSFTQSHVCTNLFAKDTIDHDQSVSIQTDIQAYNVSITKTKLTNGIFPVYSPSGEHIGSLVGAAISTRNAPKKLTCNRNLSPMLGHQQTQVYGPPLPTRQEPFTSFDQSSSASESVIYHYAGLVQNSLGKSLGLQVDLPLQTKDRNTGFTSVDINLLSDQHGNIPMIQGVGPPSKHSNKCPPRKSKKVPKVTKKRVTGGGGNKKHVPGLLGE